MFDRMKIAFKISSIVYFTKKSVNCGLEINEYRATSFWAKLHSEYKFPDFQRILKESF